jgi:hypothetical protein
MPPIVRAAAPETESVVQSKIRLALSRQGLVVVWRNAQLAAPVATGFARGGLGTGSADLVGFVRATGPARGRFFALEVKRPRGGRVSEEQQTWIALVNEGGGYACVARSAEEAEEHAARAARGERHDNRRP